MRTFDDPETLGASLMSVALLSGFMAWVMGWFAVEVTTPDASVLGRDLPAPKVAFAPPPQVQVKRLDPADSG
ncbi:hypothetical protein [Pseudooceanicola sp. MF1-13]|uniref:hypothetical protein n=1 Tax=Pseudooceanicola sp. MF1-13 TaxID=3379095 RepID=UPI0038925025